MARLAEIRCVVLYSPRPRQLHEWPVALAPGSTVLQALQACELRATFPDLDLHSVPVGVWGRRAGLEQVLRDGDRVEVYRPLEVDPKLARRQRFRKQGAGLPGLFARGKSGSKAGY